VTSIQQLKEALFSRFKIKVHYMQNTSPFPVFSDHGHLQNALRLMSSYLQYNNSAATTQKCKACRRKINQIVAVLQR